MTDREEHQLSGEGVEDVAELVYRDLRRIAGSFFEREDVAVTLQPTALVHEAYLRLAGQDASKFQNRAHFLSIAARMMRRILVDAARSRGRVKRGGDHQRVTLSNEAPEAEQFEVDALDLETALTRLAEVKERYVQLVELRFYAGMTIPEIAKVLELSERQVFKDWNMTRSYLAVYLGGDSGEPGTNEPEG